MAETDTTPRKTDFERATAARDLAQRKLHRAIVSRDRAAARLAPLKAEATRLAVLLTHAEAHPLLTAQPELTEQDDPTAVPTAGQGWRFAQDAPAIVAPDGPEVEPVDAPFSATFTTADGGALGAEIVATPVDAAARRAEGDRAAVALKAIVTEAVIKAADRAALASRQRAHADTKATEARGRAVTDSPQA